MIAYDGLKNDFLQSVVNDTIAVEIKQTILSKLGRKTRENEFNSWKCIIKGKEQKKILRKHLNIIT